MHADNAISGYTYGLPQVSTSPVSMEELWQLEAAVGWTDEDAAWLRLAAGALVPQAEQMVDSWREAIGRQLHLLAAFLKCDGQPDDAYKTAVKRRFVQWVSDLCLRPHDQQWLDYQEEIGLRHTPAKKNQTDGGHTPAVVPLRYLTGFSAVIIHQCAALPHGDGQARERTGSDGGGLDTRCPAQHYAVVAPVHN